jgi:type VII secretion protein EccE
MAAVREQPISAPPRRPGAQARATQASARPRRAPARLVRTYPGAHLGPVPVAPLVAWQVGLGLVAVGLSTGGWVLVTSVVVLLVIAVLTVVWWNGRPLWRWLRVWLAFRARNTRATVAPPHDPGLAPLREWLPHFELASLPGRRGGRPVGVAHDGSGYVVLLGPDREDLIASADPVAIPLGALATLAEAEGVRLASAQVVMRVLPAPAPSLGPYGAQLGSSYYEISQGITPAVMSWWVALRLEPGRGGTAATLDGDTVDAVRRALRAIAGRATKVLSSSGLPCRPLEESELRDVLTLTLNVDPHYTPMSRRERRTAETWRGWSCDGVAHVAGWVRGVPQTGLPALSKVLAAMAGLPVLSATASLTLTWTPENTVRCSSFVRVTAENAKTARRSFHELSRLAGRSKVGLVRLDGEQLPGVLATVPLGGGAL